MSLDQVLSDRGHRFRIARYPDTILYAALPQANTIQAVVASAPEHLGMRTPQPQGRLPESKFPL